MKFQRPPPPTDASNEDAVPRIFKAEDLHSVDGPSGPECEHHHWTSKQLHDGQSLSRVSFRCAYRGWLWLSLLPASPEHRHTMPKPKARRCLASKITRHRWIRFVFDLSLNDPLRRLARAGDRYALTYATEIGESTSLQVEQFTLHLKGEMPNSLMPT